MILNWYSIKDELAEVFFAPILFDNDDVAIRYFSAFINNKENEVVFQNPQDYTLYKLGAFDKSTGDLAANKHLLVAGKSVKKEV